jgi:NADH dehydrogenase
MITSMLLAKGKQVRILVRHDSPSEMLAQQGMATSAASLIEQGAQPVYGDLKDPASLAAACEGIDTVITTANAALRQPPDTFETVDLNGTLSLIEAAKAAGVRRFIHTSALGAAPNHPAPIYAAKGTCEAVLEQSGMTYTILQPHIFIEPWAGMVVGMPLQAGAPVHLFGKGDHRHSFVSSADVAAFAVATVDNPAAANQRIVIGGPQAHNWTEVVKMVGEAVGAELPVNYVESGSPVPLVPPTVVPIMESFEQYEAVVDMSETAPKYGVQLTPMPVALGRMFGTRVQ